MHGTAGMPFAGRVYTCLTGKPMGSRLDMSDTVLAYGNFQGKANDMRAFATRWGNRKYPRRALNGCVGLTPYGLGAHLNWLGWGNRGNLKNKVLEYLTYGPFRVEVIAYLYHRSFREETYLFDKKNQWGVTLQEVCDTGLVAYSPRFGVTVWDPELKRALVKSDSEEMLWLYANKKLSGVR